MTVSNHCIKRMNQRAINQEMVELVFEFGEYIKDRIILSRKRLKELIKTEKQYRASLLKMLDKGGVTVVVDEDTIITAYRCNWQDHRIIE